MTDKQATVYQALEDRGKKYPTVRSLATDLEKRFHRSERWSDDEVRGLLERLEADGKVTQFRDEGDRVRYKPVKDV